MEKEDEIEKAKKYFREHYEMRRAKQEQKEEERKIEKDKTTIIKDFLEDLAEDDLVEVWNFYCENACNEEGILYGNVEEQIQEIFDRSNDYHDFFNAIDDINDLENSSYCRFNG